MNEKKETEVDDTSLVSNVILIPLTYIIFPQNKVGLLTCLQHLIFF